MADKGLHDARAFINVPKLAARRNPRALHIGLLCSARAVLGPRHGIRQSGAAGRKLVRLRRAQPNVLRRILKDAALVAPVPVEVVAVVTFLARLKEPVLAFCASQGLSIQNTVSSQQHTQAETPAKNIRPGLNTTNAIYRDKCFMAVHKCLARTLALASALANRVGKVGRSSKRNVTLAAFGGQCGVTVDLAVVARAEKALAAGLASFQREVQKRAARAKTVSDFVRAGGGCTVKGARFALPVLHVGARCTQAGRIAHGSSSGRRSCRTRNTDSTVHVQICVAGTPKRSIILGNVRNNGRTGHNRCRHIIFGKNLLNVFSSQVIVRCTLCILNTVIVQFSIDINQFGSVLKQLSGTRFRTRCAQNFQNGFAIKALLHGALCNLGRHPAKRCVCIGKYGRKN